MTSARLRRGQTTALDLATAPSEEKQTLNLLHLQGLHIPQRNQSPSASLGQLVTPEELQLHLCLIEARPNSK